MTTKLNYVTLVLGSPGDFDMEDMDGMAYDQGDMDDMDGYGDESGDMVRFRFQT